MAINEIINNVPDKKIVVRITILIWLNLICVVLVTVLGLVLNLDLLKIDKTSIYNGLIHFGRFCSFFILAISVLSGVYADGRVIKIKKYLFFLVFVLACLALWLNFSAKLRMPDSITSNLNLKVVDVNQMI